MRTTRVMTLPAMIALTIGPVAAQRWSIQRASPPSYRLDLPDRPVAAPADASIPQPAIGRQVDGIDDDIRAGRTGGQLTRKESRRLRREAGTIDTLDVRYGADGLSQAERRELQVRTEVMRDIVRQQRLRPKP